MQQGQQPQGPRDTYPLTMTTDPSVLHRLSSYSCTSLWVGRVWSLQIFSRGGYAEGPAHRVVQERGGFRTLLREGYGRNGANAIFSHRHKCPGSSSQAALGLQSCLPVQDPQRPPIFPQHTADFV